MLKRLLATTLLVLSSLTLATTATATTEHCPGKPGVALPDGVVIDYEGGADNDTVLSAGTLVCVKGATDATGIVTADGQTSLVGILGNGHDVSYYVVYSTEPTPPTETPPPTTSTPPPPTTSPPTPEPTDPPSTPSPPPTTATANCHDDNSCWTPTWTPSGGGGGGTTSPGEYPDLAKTGGSAAVPGIIAVVLALVGGSALWYARKLK